MAVSWMVSDPFYSEGVGHLVNPTNGRSCEKNIGHRFTRMRQIKQKDKSRASKLFIPLIRLIRVHLWLTSSYFSQLLPRGGTDLTDTGSREADHRASCPLVGLNFCATPSSRVALPCLEICPKWTR